MAEKGRAHAETCGVPFAARQAGTGVAVLNQAFVALL
jgi:hypothetical protein